MEEIKSLDVPRLLGRSQQRLQVPLLPLWTLAMAKVREHTNTSTGTGFDREPKVAAAKAYSEALERYVYELWQTTGVSPFSGMDIPCPDSTTGMAAHLIPELSAKCSYWEWKERALLLKASCGLYKMNLVQPPKLGKIFNLLCKGLIESIECMVGTDTEPLAFVAITLAAGGVIFGSAVRSSANDAVFSALVECLRKTAFVKYWRSESFALEGPPRFVQTVRHWLSGQGVASAFGFQEKALGGHNDGIPIQFRQECSSIIRVGIHTVSFYSDPADELPKLGDLSVPLL
ncbi:hypothetical protein WDW37_08020 [Bdellovibrionota bacterium FG-1]